MSNLPGNSTILDCILTDEGRRRIAEGRFEITNFSLYDDEIVYDKATQSGTPQQIADRFESTPIREATTDNVKALKYELLTLTPQLDKFNKTAEYKHLNVTRLVTDLGGHDGTPQATGTNAGYYVVISTKDTYDTHYSNSAPPSGFLQGYDSQLLSNVTSQAIKIDHGLNDDTANGAVSDWKQSLPSELEETEFSIKLDARLGRILNEAGAELAPISVDDDNIANYIVTTNSNPGMFKAVKDAQNASPLTGNRGPRMFFSVMAATDIKDSTDTIWAGAATSLGRQIDNFFGSGNHAYAIDTAVMIEGLTTNVNITVPLRFVKKV